MSKLVGGLGLPFVFSIAEGVASYCDVASFSQKEEKKKWRDGKRESEDHLAD